MAPSPLTAALCSPPALTWVASTVGGTVFCQDSSPQQARLPSVLTPQVCASPAVTMMKEPPGGIDWPNSMFSFQLVVPAPQQAIVPFDCLTAQVCHPPALTCVKGPALSTACPAPLWPQHSTAPLLLTPQV